jgi:hypothetical protein
VPVKTRRSTSSDYRLNITNQIDEIVESEENQTTSDEILSGDFPKKISFFVSLIYIRVIFGFLPGRY